MEELGVTWGGILLHPLQQLMIKFGIDPHAGADAVMVSVLLIIFAYFGGRRFRGKTAVVPAGKVSLPFMMEFIIGGMLSFFNGIIQGGARNLFFLLGTFSFFILGNNLIGLVPGFGSPTDQYNVTVVLALMTFFTAHYIGIKTHGPAYIKKFMGPVWWMAPLMFPIEIISHLVRPLSLSMRLFGNMTGDHKVVGVFTALFFLGLPIPFMGLGIFVSVLQTFVFVLLSCVYIQDAKEHAH